MKSIVTQGKHCVLSQRPQEMGCKHSHGMIPFRRLSLAAGAVVGWDGGVVGGEDRQGLGQGGGRGHGAAGTLQGCSGGGISRGRARWKGGWRRWWCWL